MSAPKAPQEDPAVVQQRKDEAARAENDRIKAIQEQLQFETEQRSARFGVRSLLRGSSLLGPPVRRLAANPGGTLSSLLGVG